MPAQHLVCNGLNPQNHPIKKRLFCVVALLCLNCRCLASALGDFGQLLRASRCVAVDRRVDQVIPRNIRGSWSCPTRDWDLRSLGCMASGRAPGRHSAADDLL
jgi:hypothetical protein